MTAIPALLVLAAAVKAALWAHAHPGLAVCAAAGLVLLVIGIIRFCREIAPALAVRSWGSPARERAAPLRSCPDCGWEAAA